MYRQGSRIIRHWKPKPYQHTNRWCYKTRVLVILTDMNVWYGYTHQYMLLMFDVVYLDCWFAVFLPVKFTLHQSLCRQIITIAVRFLALIMSFLLGCWLLHRLWWRHNGHGRVSNHQPYDCLLKGLFRRRSKKTSKLRVTGLCAGNSPVTGEFHAQRASYAENVSIWWRHHDFGDWLGGNIPWSHTSHNVIATNKGNSQLLYIQNDAIVLIIENSEHKRTPEVMTAENKIRKKWHSIFSNAFGKDNFLFWFISWNVLPFCLIYITWIIWLMALPIMKL